MLAYMEEVREMNLTSVSSVYSYFNASVWWWHLKLKPTELSEIFITNLWALFDCRLCDNSSFETSGANVHVEMKLNENENGVRVTLRKVNEDKLEKGCNVLETLYIHLFVFCLENCHLMLNVLIQGSGTWKNFSRSSFFSFSFSFIVSLSIPFFFFIYFLSSWFSLILFLNM